MNLDALVNRILAPLKRRVVNMAIRAAVTGVDDSKKAQLLTLTALAGETRGDVEHFQPYGFTSSPKKDAEAVILRLRASADESIVLVVQDRRYRITNLQSGEVCVYDSTGSKVLMKSNGDIELTPSSGKVKLTGDLQVTGDVVAGTVSLKNHTHVAGTLAAGSTPVTGSTGAPI